MGTDNNDRLADKVNDLTIGLATLKKDSEIQAKVLEKMDRQVDGIHDLTQAMHRMVSIHEQKFVTQGETNNRLDLLIDEQRRDNKETQTQTINKMDKMDSSIEELKLIMLTKKDRSESIGHGGGDGTHHSRTGAAGQTIDWLLNNWKIIAFGFAFAAGIVTHKWGLFTTLMGN